MALVQGLTGSVVCAGSLRRLCPNPEQCSKCLPRTFSNHPRAGSWHPTLNGTTRPENVFLNSNRKFWFFCNECSHSFAASCNHVARNDSWCPYCAGQKRCVSMDCTVCTAHSFAGYEDEAKQSCWLKERNGGLTPRDVARNGETKRWFKCDRPECGHEFEASTSSIASGEWCPHCAGKRRCDSFDCICCTAHSFAGYADKSKMACWVVDRNQGLTPRDVALNDTVRRWFKCSRPECAHVFEASPNMIVSKNCWCPYCVNQKRCEHSECTWCTTHSFASYTDSAKLRCWLTARNGGLTPRNVALSGHLKRWFQCSAPACAHEFEASPATVVAGSWCPFCANKRRCDSRECGVCTAHSFAGCTDQMKLGCWLIDRNGGLTPRDVALNDHRKRWFQCDQLDCCHQFDIAPHSILSQGSWCPMCKKKTERKLQIHLESLHQTAGVQTQFRMAITGRSFFDFCLPLLKIILELDGPQHFTQISNWSNHNDTRRRDIIKMVGATTSGYHVVRLIQLEVSKDAVDWKSHLTAVLCWLSQRARPTVVYICSESNVWTTHAEDFRDAAPSIQQVRVDLVDGVIKDMISTHN